MDPLSVFNSAIDRERLFSTNPSGTDSSSSRPDIAGDGPRRDPPPRLLNETQLPAAVPKALENMLKTTTEIGDTGIFSTKPPRFPSLSSPRRSSIYNDNGLQKPQRAFRPYGVPSIDDRRLLPSYARDASVDRISTYRTSSPPKSGRVFSDPDYRAYSMVQASCSRLSNHRSFRSLRSQVEGGDLQQRPRSPFAYPTHLRSAGFSPSSPASADESGDPRRRSNVDRVQRGTSHSTASPSSLYAQKRMPPVALLPEANRSATSLLNRPIPPRRSSSPLVLQNHGSHTCYRSRRDAPTSMNTTPTRSTSSRESAANIYPIKSPPSDTATPMKNGLQSQYYDCEEDFEKEDLHLADVKEPTAQFRMTASIPEERPLSADRSSLVALNSRNAVRTFNNSARISSSSATIHQVPIQVTQDSRVGKLGANDLWQFLKANPATQCPADEPSSNKTEIERNMEPVRMSISEHETRELVNHVDTAFNHYSFGPLALRNPESEDILGSELKEYRSTVSAQKRSRKEMPERPASGSGRKKQSHIAVLRESEHRSDDSSSISRISESQHKLSNPTKFASTGPEFPTPPTLSKKNIQRHQKYSPERSSSLGFSSQHQKQMKTNSFNFAGKGVADAVGFVSSLEASGRPQSPCDKANITMAAYKRTTDSPTIPEHQALPHRDISPPVALSNRQRKGPQAAKHLLKYNYFQQGERQPASAQKGADVPNFTPDIPRKSVSRDGAPLLAPKPLSPARQFELKNSVPHLMESLPFTSSYLPPIGNRTAAEEISCFFSPLTPESRAVTADEAQSASKLTEIAAENGMHAKDSTEVPKNKQGEFSEVSINEHTIDEPTCSLQSHPRMKLKLRKSLVLPPTSADGSQLRASEGSSLQPDCHKDTVQSYLHQGEESESSQPPKFKLRITRASNSTPDTIKINRDSGASKPMIDSHLCSPPDLFTTSGGIERIFRQVSRHLHPRKASPNSSQPSSENSPVPVPQSETIAADTQGAPVPQVPSPIPGRINPIEFHSYFSDDSSNAQGHHSLRKKISNLRARLALPYSSKGGARSYDDVSWRLRNNLGDPAARSVPNLDTSDMGVDEAPLQQSTEHARLLKLRQKFSRWFKDARSAIRSRMKSLSSNGGRGGGKS